MLNWVIIGIFVLAIVIISKVVHFEHFQKKIFFILILFVIAFLCLSIAGVVKTHNLDLRTSQGVIDAGKFYFLWLSQAFGNVKSLTGQAIDMKWAPENITVSDSFKK